MFRATVSDATVISRGYRIFGLVINRVGKIADFSHKYCKGFVKWAAHPCPIFLGVPHSSVGHWITSMNSSTFLYCIGEYSAVG